ncbi:Crp/Fnr family transcriptional regulator [Devosia sp. A449]
MIRDDAAEALAQAEFFDICDDEQRRMLAFAGDLRRFDPDAVLYQAGAVPEGAYVLVDGTLKAKPDSGKPYTIAEPGSVVSAMALILAKPRPVSISAVTECTALFVPRTAFLKLVQQSPELAQRAVARVERDLGDYLGALEPVRRKMKADDS